MINNVKSQKQQLSCGEFLQKWLFKLLGKFTPDCWRVVQFLLSRIPDLDSSIDIVGYNYMHDLPIFVTLHRIERREDVQC